MGKHTKKVGVAASEERGSRNALSESVSGVTQSLVIGDSLVCASQTWESTDNKESGLQQESAPINGISY